MTRKRFNGLRMELCRRICENAGQKFDPTSLRDLRPDFTKVYSYKQAWEQLKPARDIVGM